MKNYKLLSKAEMKRVKGGYFCIEVTCPDGLACSETLQACVNPDGIPAQGTPGGNNGNPCPTYCEPTGATIYCAGYRNGIPTALEGNCNTWPSTQVSGLHNLCIAQNGNFWC